MKWKIVKKVEVFKAGHQIDSRGEDQFVGIDMLKDMASQYDPTVHEAPVIYGHSSDNMQEKMTRDSYSAEGWVKNLYVEGRSLYADLEVNPDMLDRMKHEFKKRSLAYYEATSRTNPLKGKPYVRHLALLSAQPPAIKGLKDVDFNNISSYSESQGSNTALETYKKLIRLISLI